ncbi:MAG: bifunctional diguanylate cyclase/phosphodiesterase [Campylobacterota bacterium]
MSSKKLLIFIFLINLTIIIISTITYFSFSNIEFNKSFFLPISLWITILAISLIILHFFIKRELINPISKLSTIIKEVKNKNNLIITHENTKQDIKTNEIKNITDNFKFLTEQLNMNIAFLNSYRSVLDDASIVSKADLDGNITYVNDNLIKVSGYSKDELIGSNHSILKHPDTPREVFSELWETITNKKVWKGIIKNKKKNGDAYWVSIVIRPLFDENNNIKKYIALRNEITELVNQREELKLLANTDKLTNLKNRSKLFEDIKKIEFPAVAFLNIDNFRQVNDFYGDIFGDKLLKKIGEFLVSNCKKDLEYLSIYRTQADEFAILASLGANYEKEIFYSKVYQIVRKINSSNFIINKEEISITLTASLSYENRENLFTTANMALKYAKKNGMHLATYKDEFSLDDVYKSNLKWTIELKNAIKKNKIVPYFQPIINNKTNKIEKYESLVRLIDTQDKVVSPFFFLNVAKQTKHYNQITKIMIKKSFKKFQNLDFDFSINLTIDDILNNEIKTYIYTMLQKYQIGSQVVFEIVESESIENFQEVSNFISDVKKHGCKIAIDDFGTGYSNFEYLLKLNADYIKIDGSMIKNIHKDKNSKIVVTTIVNFAKQMDMKTVAEFVENKEILDEIKNLGIDYSQGYYFSAPLKNIEY